jgi:hypothetical protein
MDIRSAFPSKYLSAVDLAASPTRSVRVTIESIEMETMKSRERGDEEKAIVYFRGKTKGLVLNKTNSNTIAHSFGFDTDDWIGQTIELYTAEVEAFGEMVEAIRVRIPKAATPPPKKKPELVRQTEPMQAAVGAEGHEPPSDDDQIPF